MDTTQETTREEPQSATLAGMPVWAFIALALVTSGILIGVLALTWAVRLRGGDEVVE